MTIINRGGGLQFGDRHFGGGRVNRIGLDRVLGQHDLGQLDGVIPAVLNGAAGQLFASADEGESWTELASYLPAIASVEVAVVD